MAAFDPTRPLDRRLGVLGTGRWRDLVAVSSRPRRSFQAASPSLNADVRSSVVVVAQMSAAGGGGKRTLLIVCWSPRAANRVRPSRQ